MVRIWNAAPNEHEGMQGGLFRRGTDLAVLHYISLPQPSLVEWFARGMDDMAQSVLFGQYEHRVKQTFHSAGGLNQSGTKVSQKGR